MQLTRRIRYHFEIIVDPDGPCNMAMGHAKGYIQKAPAHVGLGAH